MTKVLVTGASGYIGTCVLRHARHAGISITATSRRPSDIGAPDLTQFDLKNPSAFLIPPDVDAVLHLAADAGLDSDQAGEQELAAARNLLQQCEKSGARFVFVSSQSARSDAPTPYGRTKRRIELIAMEAGACIVRPGMVYGGARFGLFGSLLHLAETLPVFPLFLPAPLVQPIHVDDLAAALLTVVQRDDLSGRILCLGAPEPCSFSFFMRAMVRLRARRRFIPVPVPTRLVELVRKLLGNRAQNLGLARLQSLFELRTMDSSGDLKALEVSLRALDDGMHRSGSASRRSLLLEGRALMRYVGGAAAPLFMLRRYASAIASLRDGRSMGLARVFVGYPPLLALLDSPRACSSACEELRWRIDAATRVVEASTFGSVRILGLGERRSMLRHALLLTGDGMAELFWRALRLVLHPALRFYLKRMELRYAD